MSSASASNLSAIRAEPVLPYLNWELKDGIRGGLDTLYESLKNSRGKVKHGALKATMSHNGIEVEGFITVTEIGWLGDEIHPWKARVTLVVWYSGAEFKRPAVVFYDDKLNQGKISIGEN